MPSALALNHRLEESMRDKAESKVKIWYLDRGSNSYSLDFF